MKRKTVFPYILFLAVTLSAGDVIATRRSFRREASDRHYEYGYLLEKMHHPDAEIARYAVTLLAEHHQEKAVASFRKLSFPTDPLIAEAVLVALSQFPETETADLRDKILSGCSDPGLQSFRKVRLPYRVNVSLRNDPSYDHAVTVVKTIPLPRDNWSFITDPDDEGFRKNFHAVDFDDSAWRKIAIAKSWEAQNVGNYDGVAWYRVKFRMPEKMNCSGVDLSFCGVDESAWVWLNGKYVGQHNIGPAGWNVPFYLNIASELKWGEENLLAVRVKDTTGAGGIWKPAAVEVLQ